MEAKKCMLLILDGWGLGENVEVDALAQASTPVMDKLMKTYPKSTLITYGGEVGLPNGQMGNSEVGHLNIGAGRVVYQELARINKAISDRTLEKNDKLQLALHDLLSHIEGKHSRVATVVGRYYAMDRDTRWERTAIAYDLMVKGKASFYTEDVLPVVKANYADGKTDEFMPAIQVIDDNANAIGNIANGDVVLFSNFRTDRPRQITEVLTQKDYPDHEMVALDLSFFTMTTYDSNFEGIKVLFEKDNLQQTIGEVLANHGKTQVRIAETEKYPHVTFFFSGGREEPFQGESRILKASPKVATYDLAPEMSAEPLTEAIIEKIETDQPDFIVLKFANTDMIGHTGDFKAAMKAAEVVDSCVGKIQETLMKHDYRSLVIADHGNSDYMINPDGTPHTAHTTNLVPCILTGNDVSDMQVKDGKLGDIAPTILHLMGVPIPQEMDGNVLIK